MQKAAGGSNADFDVSTSAYSNSNSAGTYKLNGYSIEMRYNNGEVVRRLFYFYPDSRTTFGIGGDAYVPD
jgi:predicted secreted protein